MDQVLNNSRNSGSDFPADDDFEAKGASAVERLASVIARNARASAVFGEPVHQGSSVIVPVAKATWGAGGGKGPQGNGEGGGGGMHIAPVGFIHLENGRARYRPIRKSALVFGTIAVLAGALVLRGRQLRSIRRDMKAQAKAASLLVS